jgi:transcription initiation factor TFIIB
MQRVSTKTYRAPPTTQCPKCDGLVTINVIETVCEDCGLVIDDQRTTHRAEFA